MGNKHKRSIRRDAGALSLIMPYIGDLPLLKVHLGTIQPLRWPPRFRDICNAAFRYLMAMVCILVRLATISFISTNSALRVSNSVT